MKLLKQFLAIFILAAVATSCKKQLLDINTSPNDPTTVSATPNLVLANALNVSANIYDDATLGNNNFVWAGLWLGHISYSGNYAIATENISYQLTNSFASGTFPNLYDNNEDYDFVEQKGVTLGNGFYRAIGMFMKAYNYQTLVDLYNNVPYTQALKGTGVSNPAYDGGKAIYDDLSKKMDTAISLFKLAASGNTAIQGDIMFSGNATSWYKLANTVKLRLLLRQSEVNGAAAKTQAAALTGGFLTANAGINPGYVNSVGKRSPFFESNYNSAGAYSQDLYRAGQYGVNFYTAHNDPRLSRFYTATQAGLFKGNFFGDQGIPNSLTSTIGPGVLQAYNQPAILMLASESYFLQAEAVLRGWIPGDPQALYQSGVAASFTYVGANYPPVRNVANTADSITYTPTTSALKYYTQPGDKQTTWSATSSFAEQLALIIRQKWASETWINELEPYNDYRRLHLPADVPLSTSPFSTNIFPNRLRYPQRELDVNSANVLAAGSDTPATKVWWQP